MAASAAPTIHLQFDHRPTAWCGHAGPYPLALDRGLPGFVDASATPLAAAPDFQSAPVQWGRGWIGNAERAFSVRRQSGHTMLEADVGAVAWSSDGGRVWLPRAVDDAQLAIELGLGIGLVAALAARETFCLHASALLWRDGALAVAGASGAGKSTFARALDAAGRARRIADDILPVDACARAWAAFPQLKLAPALWWPAQADGLPLRAIVMLARGERVACERLDNASAMRAVLARTAGTRAFSAAALQAHLAQCATLAARVPVFQLQIAERAAAPDSAALEAFDLLHTLA